MTTLAEKYGDVIRGAGWMNERIRELEARNAKLEAVYEAVKDMPRLNLFWSVGVRIAMEDAEPAPTEPPQEVQVQDVQSLPED